MINSIQKNIYLIGFMGSGKSTVGPLLAEKMNRAFFDTDQWIVNETGKTIPDIFSGDGEDSFREKEREAIEIAGSLKNLVASVGGGAVVDSRNWLRLKRSGLIIYLKCEPRTIYERVKSDWNRPLLNQVEDKMETITGLLAKRAPIYEGADVIVESDNFTAEFVAERILEKIKGLA